MSQPQPSQPPRHLPKKSASLPDFFFAVIFTLFSSSNHSSIFRNKLSPPSLSCPFSARRFLRISSMSLSLTSRTSRSRKPDLAFPTPQSLSDWLKPRLPSDSFASWGIKPGTKNVHNLWLELSEGEILLDDSTPPIRSVEVVIVRVIGKGNKILVESHQELSNGDIRNRCRPLSEKMKPGETIEGAAVRAVKEELGSVISQYDDETIRIVPNSYVKKVEERVSVSYPGLPACYVLHTVDATVDGLPDGEFCTEEAEEYGDEDCNRVANGAVSCKKHYWKWVDGNSL